MQAFGFGRTQPGGNHVTVCTVLVLFVLIVELLTINSDPPKKVNIPCFSDRDNLHNALE